MRTPKGSKKKKKETIKNLSKATQAHKSKGVMFTAVAGRMRIQTQDSNDGMNKGRQLCCAEIKHFIK